MDEEGISISHLVGAGNEARKLVLFFLLSFNHCLHNARMVGAKIDKAMGDAGLPFHLERLSRVVSFYRMKCAGWFFDIGALCVPPIVPRKKQMMSCT